MRAIVFAFAAAMPVTAQAEVKASAVNGFEIEHKAVVQVAPNVAYAALGRIGGWWNSGHTYSGKAANLRLDLRAGGCFCESWGGGTVEHGRVIFARPGQLLRVSAALGPLQGEAVAGTLTWTLKPVAAGTEVTLRYAVGGYVPGGADKYAKPVDQVLGEQMASFARSLARPTPGG